MTLISVEPTRILLIEDEPNDTELIQLTLDRHKLVNHIDIVDDGEKAIDYLHRRLDSQTSGNLPNLVLLDLKLPKIDGVEVLKNIRTHPRLQELTVIIMAAAEEDPELPTCYELGITGCIIKPFSLYQLMEIVNPTEVHWVMINHLPLGQ